MRVDRATAGEVAEDLGITASLAAKASWLASSYPEEARRRIGLSALRTLGASHLEVVALVPDPIRAELLGRTIREGIGVRHLKELAATAAVRDDPRRVSSVGAAELAGSAKAVDTYLAFDDEHLKRLLAGPNGRTITRLARSGAALAARIAEHQV